MLCVRRTWIIIKGSSRKEESLMISFENQFPKPLCAAFQSPWKLKSWRCTHLLSLPFYGHLSSWPQNPCLGPASCLPYLKIFIKNKWAVSHCSLACLGREEGQQGEASPPSSTHCEEEQEKEAVLAVRKHLSLASVLQDDLSLFCICHGWLPFQISTLKIPETICKHIGIIFSGLTIVSILPEVFSLTPIGITLLLRQHIVLADDCWRRKS